MKLMKTSQFFRQFDLDVKYKFNKKHILFDILSRLTSINIDISILKDYFKFDILFIITLMQMNFNFHNKCV